MQILYFLLLCARKLYSSSKAVCLTHLCPSQANDFDVIINNWTGKVECSDAAVQERIKKAVDRFQEALRPCTLDVEDA